MLPQGLWKNGHLTLDTGALWVQVFFKRQRGYRICQGLGWGWSPPNARAPHSPLFLASLSCNDSCCIMSPIMPLKGKEGGERIALSQPQPASTSFSPRQALPGDVGKARHISLHHLREGIHIKVLL